MHVLVTGGSGFIGQAVITDLESRNHLVRVFDRHHSPFDDIRDMFHVTEAVADVDGVIHLAGVLGTAELYDRFDEAVSINIKGTYNVMSACAQYGKPYVGIIMPDVWANVYQATKKFGRTMATALHNDRGLKCSHVRAFNAYGRGQHVYGVQKIIPTFATRAWRDLPIPVWGDGYQCVDLVHVSDVARMLVDALAFHDDEVFDAGTGKTQKVIDIARYIIQYTESSSRIEFLPMRPGETPTEEIFARGEGWERLGWTPHFDTSMLDDVIDYYRSDRP